MLFLSFTSFAYADVVDAGVTVMVLTNNQAELATEIADDMNDYIQKNKVKFEYPLPVPSQAVKKAVKEIRSGRGPVLLADLADRMGDSTHILHELAKKGVRNYAVGTIADPDAVSLISKNMKVGHELTLSIGGYSSDLAGKPFPVDGTVAFIGEFDIGRSGVKDNVVALTFGNNNWIILTPTRYQARTADIFYATGVPLDEIDILIVKSRVHFRRGFIETGLINQAFLVDAPGHGPADIGTLTYINHPPSLYSKYFNN